MKLQFLAIAILAAPVAAAAGRGATPLPRMRSIAPRALKLRGGATVTPASEGLIAHIVSQVSYEIANCNTSPAKKFGFCGKRLSRMAKNCGRSNFAATGRVLILVSLCA